MRSEGRFSLVPKSARSIVPPLIGVERWNDEGFLILPFQRKSLLELDGTRLERSWNERSKWRSRGITI